MRTFKVTSQNIQFFDSYLTEEEKTRLEKAQIMALGAAAGISPCGIVLFTVEAREAHLEKIYVEEGFRRRGVATGLLEQIGKRIPGLFKLSCSYQENRCPAFDSLLKSRKDFFFEDESYPVYVVEKEEAELIRRLLRELPAAYHDILVLRYYYGLSVKEAAKILGISQNAAQVRLHRAKEKLGEALDEEGIR